MSDLREQIWEQYKKAVTERILKSARGQLDQEEERLEFGAFHKIVEFSASGRSIAQLQKKMVAQYRKAKSIVGEIRDNKETELQEDVQEIVGEAITNAIEEIIKR